MSNVPAPIRAYLGLMDTAVRRARDLADRAPELPMEAVAAAMQLSLKAQQRFAEFTARGDDVIGRIRGVPDEPPSWATFDDDQPTGSAEVGREPADRLARPAGAEPAAPPVSEDEKAAIVARAERAIDEREGLADAPASAERGLSATARSGRPPAGKAAAGKAAARKAAARKAAAGKAAAGIAAGSTRSRRRSVAPTTSVTSPDGAELTTTSPAAAAPVVGKLAPPRKRPATKAPTKRTARTTLASAEATKRPGNAVANRPPAIAAAKQTPADAAARQMPARRSPATQTATKTTTKRAARQSSAKRTPATQTAARQAPAKAAVTGTSARRSRSAATTTRRSATTTIRPSATTTTRPSAGTTTRRSAATTTRPSAATTTRRADALGDDLRADTARQLSAFDLAQDPTPGAG